MTGMLLGSGGVLSHEAGGLDVDVDSSDWLGLWSTVIIYYGFDGNSV